MLYKRRCVLCGKKLQKKYIQTPLDSPFCGRHPETHKTSLVLSLISSDFALIEPYSIAAQLTITTSTGPDPSIRSSAAGLT